MTAWIVFAHGSSIESANEAVRLTAQAFAGRGGYEYVRAAFLDGGSPDLLECVEQAVRDGNRRILVLPYFLTLGLHLQRDLPKLVSALERQHPGVRVEIAPPLDGHPALVEILLDRARELDAKGTPAP